VEIAKFTVAAEAAGGTLNEGRQCGQREALTAKLNKLTIKVNRPKLSPRT
jgi:hypothetical protein